MYINGKDKEPKMDNTKKMLRISNINTKETTMELYDIDWNAIEKIFDDLEETFNLFNEDEEQ